MEIPRAIIAAAVLLSAMITAASAIAGTATYYTTYLPSACYGFADQGTMIAAANPSLYANGGACGSRYTIRCTGGTNQTPNPCRNGQVTVTIVDLCPGCGPNQFDLSYEAFSVIGNPDAGRIQIDYTQ
ncbi:hypothetical protein M569_06763 [Genlisea aurea]|uniref:Expansin-like EG45 domain-containing protein n=1 Tax=Genlisea aurea TaxID=192259 RepID=S8E6J7_9LAMI|nr:hypothetical protein M569_06763 [Genlisea aurea]